MTATPPDNPDDGPTRGVVGRRRREQVIEAAVAIITGPGLQHLSLSEIEKQTGMKRGHLMYYFPAKEDILLAAFDRLLDMALKRAHESLGAGEGEDVPFSRRLRFMLEHVTRVGPLNPALHALEYTFLSQMSHRPDFRARLARLHEDWRSRMADDYAREHPGGGTPPRAVASLVMAIVQGLAVQLATDPGAFDRAELLNVLVQFLAPLCGPGVAGGAGAGGVSDVCD